MKTCFEIEQLMTLYVDDELDYEQRKDLADHLETCERCREEFERVKQMTQELNHLGHIALPEGFHEEMLERMSLNRGMDFKDYLSTVAAAIVCFVVVTATLSAIQPHIQYRADNNLSAGVQMDVTTGAERDRLQKKAVAADTEQATGNSQKSRKQAAEQPSQPNQNSPNVMADTQSTTADTKEKIVRTCQINLSVDDMQQAVSQIEALSGNVETMNRYIGGDGLENCSITQRVPTAQFDASIAAIRQLGTVHISFVSAQDVTEDYTDTGIRLGAKKQEESRLFDIMKKAERMQDMLTLETRLAEIRSGTEENQSTLNRYAKDTRTSVIEINLQSNKKETTVDTLGARMQSAFVKSFAVTTACFAQVLVVFSSVFSWIIAVGVIVLFTQIRKRWR